jgi:hypothetical protein
MSTNWDQAHSRPHRKIHGAAGELTAGPLLRTIASDVVWDIPKGHPSPAVGRERAA